MNRCSPLTTRPVPCAARTVAPGVGVPEATIEGATDPGRGQARAAGGASGQPGDRSTSVARTLAGRVARVLARVAEHRGAASTDTDPWEPLMDHHRTATTTVTTGWTRGRRPRPAAGRLLPPPGLVGRGSTPARRVCCWQRWTPSPRRLGDLLARTLHRRVWVTDADNWAETVTATCALGTLEASVDLDGEHFPACAGTLVSRGIGRRLCEVRASLTDAQLQEGSAASRS